MKLPALLVAILASCQGVGTQPPTVGPCDEPGDRTHCEVRTWSLPAPASLRTVGLHSADVVVEAWDQPHAEIVATLAADGDRARERVRAVRVTVQEGEVRVADPGRPAVDDEPLLEVRAYVPQATPLDLSTHNGSIAVLGPTAPVRLRTQNGALVAQDVTGPLVGHTQNGVARVDLPPGHGDVDLWAQNGQIRVAAPADWEGRVVARVGRGSLVTNLGDPRPTPDGEGTVLGTGGPGPTVRLTSENGRVTVLRD